LQGANAGAGELLDHQEVEEMTRIIRVISMAAILAVMGSIIAGNALASGKTASAVRTASTTGDL